MAFEDSVKAWQAAVDNGLIQGDPKYYSGDVDDMGNTILEPAAQPDEYHHALLVAILEAHGIDWQNSGDPTPPPPDTGRYTHRIELGDVNGLQAEPDTLYVGGKVNGQLRIHGVQHVRFDGVEVTGARTGPQEGGVSVEDSGDVIVSNAHIHGNDGVGMQVRGVGAVHLWDSLVEWNGQLGLGGWGKDSGNRNHIGGSVIGNVVRHNNEGRVHNWGWEAGGSKFWSVNGLEVRGNRFESNWGPGIWLDHDNIHFLIEDNFVADNAGPGIYHEIGYGGVIRNNRVERCGFDQEVWLFGSGIQLSTSSDTLVEGNTVIDCYNGIGIVTQNRGSGEFGPYVSYRNTVRGNVVDARMGSGLVQDTGNQLVFSDDPQYRNVFEGNTYNDGHRFEWQNGWKSRDQWRQFHPGDAL